MIDVPAVAVPVLWYAVPRRQTKRALASLPAFLVLRIVNGWFSFGEYDVLLVCEMPDAVSAAALSMAISSSGAVKAVKTTPLMTFDEGVAALKKASSAEYAAPATEIPYFGTYRSDA